MLCSFHQSLLHFFPSHCSCKQQGGGGLQPALTHLMSALVGCRNVRGDITRV